MTEMNSNQQLAGKSIMLLIVGHLANAPRAQKAARAAIGAGANVMVRGVLTDGALRDEDRNIARKLGADFAYVADLRTDGGNFSHRLRRRIGLEAYRRWGFPSLDSLGPGARNMLAEARRLSPDLVVAHCEAGLWAALRWQKKGRSVAVDFEDWFSRDLLDVDRKTRDVARLSRLERHLIRAGEFSSTTTECMSNAMARYYGAQPPVVLPNCFEYRIPKPVIDGDGARDGELSLHWFSQTVGPGRGLETLAEALTALPSGWGLTLRGALRGHQNWFEENFARFGPRVRLNPPVGNHELLDRIACHDVGLALELPYCDNKEFTASNKIFDYMRGGLAVVATRTAGQTEAMQAVRDVGLLVDPGDSDALRAAISRLIASPELVAQLKSNATEAARQHWEWKRWEPRLVTAYANALAVASA